MMNEYNYQTELYHHGVKGMKWGVRRFQNKDGSLTPAGKKRYSDEDRDTNIKKLANRNFDATRKYEEAYANYTKEVSEYERTHSEPKKYWNADGTMSKEARKWMDDQDAFYEKYKKKTKEIDKELDAEQKSLKESVFLTEELKPQLQKAKKLRTELDSLKDIMVGVRSKAYKDAFEDYKKRHSKDGLSDDDMDYGFDHYYWPDSKERKQAMTAYTQSSEKLQKDYNNLVTDIGNRAVGHYKDQKLEKGWYDTYGEWGRNEVDDIIRFNHYQLKF